MAGAIGYAALESGDRAGLVMFSDKINKFIPTSKEATQYYRLLQVMVDKENWGGKKNLATALDFVVKLFNDRTFLFIISDFIGVGKGWEDKLKMATAKFEGVLGIMIRDIRDIELPRGTGIYRIQDPMSGRIMEVDLGKYAEEYEREAKKQMEAVERGFLSSNAGFIRYLCDEPFVTPLIRWFDLWGAGR